MLADRYEIRPSGDWFVVYDSALAAPCSLSGITMRFTTREEALDWLRFCYRTWGTNPERSEEPPAQREWGARRYRGVPEQSPWTHYTTPVKPSERPYWS